MTEVWESDGPAVGARSMRLLPAPSGSGEQLVTLSLRPDDRARLIRFFNNPELNVVGTDPGNGWFNLNVLDVEGYQKSRFLDARSLQYSAMGCARLSVHPDTLLEIYRRHDAPLPKFATIFHVGHCGSTLLANLLDENSGAFVLREPPILRWLAGRFREQGVSGCPEEWVQLAAAVISRRYDTTSLPVVKASSWCHGLIQPLLDSHPENSAVFLYTGLREYVVRYYGKRQTDIEASSERSYSLIVDLLPPSLADWNRLEGWQKATLGWVSKVRSIERAAKEGAATRIKVVSFGELLHRPEETLVSIQKKLGLSSEQDHASSSPQWQRYAKSTDREFSREQEFKNLREQEAATIEQVGKSYKLADDLVALGILTHEWRARCEEACWVESS